MAAGVVRKRNRWTRIRAKRSRPKTPAPTAGWVIAELSRLTQIAITSIRYYTRRGLIAPSEFRGRVTRYQRRELLRLLAIPRLQYEERQSLAQIKQQLDRLGESEILAWLMQRPLSPAVATALGVPAGTPEQNEAANTHAAEAGLDAPAASMWQRVALLPGLELACCSTASAAVRSIAQKIIAEYAPKP